MGGNTFQVPRLQKRRMERAARNVVKRLARKEARRLKVLERDADLAGALFGGPPAVRPPEGGSCTDADE